jgi:hypothetical protein
MTLFRRPPNSPPLSLQDDHYRRTGDLAFRHLAAAFNHYQNRTAMEPIRTLTSEHPDYGRDAHVQGVVDYGQYSSEEYSHCLAAVLLTHIWLLSAANFFRLSARPGVDGALRVRPKIDLQSTDKVDKIARELQLPRRVVDCANRLELMRNTIAHLVEPDRRTQRIDQLNFEIALAFTKCSWLIYCALMRNYGALPDRGSWLIQVNRYGLPGKVEATRNVAHAA